MNVFSRTAASAAATVAAAALLAVAGGLGTAPASAVKPTAPVLGPEVPVVYGPTVPTDKGLGSLHAPSATESLGRRIK